MYQTPFSPGLDGTRFHISNIYRYIHIISYIYNYTYIYIYISCDKPNKKQLPFGDGWNATHKHGDDLGMV